MRKDLEDSDTGFSDAIKAETIGNFNAAFHVKPDPDDISDDIAPAEADSGETIWGLALTRWENRLQRGSVASLKCKILQIKHLKPEDGTIGYGRHGLIAPEGTTIATIPVGYADGIDRHLGCGHASFSLNGHRVPTIGNICMDMCMLDITGVDAKVGDTVTIFGEDPTVSELADILGTIPYEIMTSIPRRIDREIIR